MATLTVTAADVHVVESPQQLRTRVAGAAVDAGSPVYQDSNGKVQDAQADGTATERKVIGIAVTTAAAANDPVTVAGPDSLIDLGNALSSAAYGDTMFLADAAGVLDTAAGSVSVVLGTVEAVEVLGSASAAFDKLFRVSGALPGVVG